MVLSELSLKNFRNHTHTSIDCCRGVNFLLGNNGQGKTNVIEAISYLCLTKSFYAGSDTLVPKFGEGMFEVEGRIVSDGGKPFVVRVAYLRDTNEKVFMINGRRVPTLSSVIGKFPIVIFSPEHGAVTTGGPSERRKFLDMVIAQSSRAYFKDLLGYRSVLRQRNRVLLDMKLGRQGGNGLLAPWNEQLAALGSAVWWKRHTFIAEFSPVVRSVYSRFVDVDEQPFLEYRPLGNRDFPATQGELASVFLEILAARENEEQRFGTSLVGPHRDDVAFTLDGRDLRSYASQGQHKTFIISLKLGEFLYLKSRCDETPLLMLDDVFAELDDARTARVIAYIERMGQAFLTSTHRNPVESWDMNRTEYRTIFIDGGAVTEQKTVVHV